MSNVMDPTRPSTPSTMGKVLASKVPEITVWFWIIKVLCTTIGETAADYLNVNLNFGLTTTSVVTGLLLLVLLVLQFSLRRYVPAVYWSSVTLVSVFGTLVTDNLTDAAHIPLEASTIVFSVLLALTFGAWYRSEHTLSIHSVVTRRREAFYWLTILFTFALGTAAGDLIAERLALGYLLTLVLVATVVAIVAGAWRFGLHPILSFWIIYILTRPLGASIGDYLSQSKSHGGLGLGTTATSLIFLGAIVLVVLYLSVSKADVIAAAAARSAAPVTNATRGGVLQTVVVVGLILGLGLAGYFARRGAVAADALAAAGGSAPGSPAAVNGPLGNLSAFRTITQDTLDKLSGGDQAGATTRVDDLEYAWDKAASTLQAKNGAAWTAIDGKIDTVLRELRSTSPNTTTEKAALTALVTELDGGGVSSAARSTTAGSAMSTSSTLSSSVTGSGAPPFDKPATPASMVGAKSSTAASPPSAKSLLGDLSVFTTITKDTLVKLTAGDQAGATKRVDDLESEWDKAAATLQTKGGTAWTAIDGRIDTVLKSLRAPSPDKSAETVALNALLAALSG